MLSKFCAKLYFSSLPYRNTNLSCRDWGIIHLYWYVKIASFIVLWTHFLTIFSFRDQWTTKDNVHWHSSCCVCSAHPYFLPEMPLSIYVFVQCPDGRVLKGSNWKTAPEMFSRKAKSIPDIFFGWWDASSPPTMEPIECKKIHYFCKFD